MWKFLAAALTASAAILTIKSKNKNSSNKEKSPQSELDRLKHELSVLQTQKKIDELNSPIDINPKRFEL